MALPSALVLLLGGCTSWDSFFDQSVVGQWEHTPTKVPVLERIAPIEEEPDQFVQYSDIRPSDLIPEAEPYRLAPGDSLEVTVYDLIEQGRPESYPRVIDQYGYIEFPVLGRVYLAGLTEEQAKRAIENRTSDFVENPLVSLSLTSRREQAYHLFGNVFSPGPYGIPSSDYRLLQALIAAGGIGETADWIYVIRQVPLTQEAGGPAPADEPGQAPAQPSGEELINIIEDLSGQGGGGESPLPTRPAEQMPSTGQPAEQPAGEPDSGRAPMINLVEPSQEQGGQQAPSVPEATGKGSRWVFRDGEWVKATPASAVKPTYRAEDQPAYLQEAGKLMTQRVIRIPAGPLKAGDARYNIVIRPGDVIRVAQPPIGNIYIDGEVNRPGTFALPQAGRLTLLRAITAAGGFTGLAVPERVDLTRVVGDDEQATIMLNYRAISAGEQPDVYLKADDRINVGTDFWAYPLAVVRNGFRASYGFGFLLDRNFGNDVFGPPPINRGDTNPFF